MTSRRPLGSSGFEVAPLAFGGNVFGWTADEPMSFRLLDAFVDAGFNLIDTADVYSKFAPGLHGGESETIIGKWFQRSHKRGDVVLATKVGMEMAPDKTGLSKAYIKRAVEDSLRRLQTDVIDLYQSHRDDAGTPLEETLSAYAELKQEGKIRAIGASNYAADRLEEALEVSQAIGAPSYVSLQPLYNLYDREDYEAQLQDVCEKNEIGVITYFSLASGFLSGKYRSLSDAVDRARSKMVTKYLNDRGFSILRALDSVAAEQKATAAKVAIAWLLAQPTVTAAIVSATTPEQLRDLVDATELQLDEEALQTLNDASAWRLETASA